MFGDGARHGFEWVFEGASAVDVSSVDDILEWLRGCRYETDESLFVESDFWQHPRTFEQFKRGDCEDFALWAWRKLVELGLDASLIIGRRIPPGGPRRDSLEITPTCRSRHGRRASSGPNRS